MSRLLFMKTLPQQLAQPTGIAIAASLGIHALLGLSLPNISKASKQADQNSHDVKVVELTPAEESRVPSLTPSPSPPSSTLPPPYENQPLPPPLPSLSYYPPTSPECSVNSPTLSRRKKGESNSSSQTKGDKRAKSSLSEQYCLDDLLASGGITKPPKSMKDTLRSLKDKDSKKKLDKTSDRKNNGTSGSTSIDRLVGQNKGVPGGLPGEDLSSISGTSGQKDQQTRSNASNAGGTSFEKGNEDYVSWLQKVKNNYRELEPPKTIDKMIEYSCKQSCPTSKSIVAIAVVVDPQGRIVEEGKIGDAGVELNKKALAQVPVAVQEKLEELRKNQTSEQKNKYQSFLVRFYPSGQ